MTYFCTLFCQNFGCINPLVFGTYFYLFVVISTHKYVYLFRFSIRINLSSNYSIKFTVHLVLSALTQTATNSRTNRENATQNRFFIYTKSKLTVSKTCFANYFKAIIFIISACDQQTHR